MTRDMKIGFLVGAALAVLGSVVGTVLMAVQAPTATRSEEIAMNHTFAWALGELTAGRAVRLEEWAEGELVLLKEPEAGQAMTMPYLFKVYPNRGTVPWSPSQLELLADTWQPGSIDPGPVE